MKQVFDQEEVADRQELLSTLTDVTVQGVESAYARRVQRYDQQIEETVAAAREAKANGEFERGQQLRWQVQGLIDERDAPAFSEGFVASGAGDASNILIAGSDVRGKQATTLYADNRIDIQAAQSRYEQDSSNSASGWNAGVAVNAGASGWAAGITAGINRGAGHSAGSTLTHRRASVGSEGTTALVSGGTTAIRGGQVTGHRVELDVGQLEIESLQDTERYASEQKGGSVQATYGFGVSVNGGYGQSKIDAAYASVGQQSGILAGGGGYAVNVRDRTQLVGGLITSTASAEQNGLNSFSTGTLALRNINNVAKYEGGALGINGGFGVNGKGERGAHEMAQGSADGKSGGLAGQKSVGFGRDSDSQRSITSSGINTRDITITDATGQAATGKAVEQIKAEAFTATTTDTATRDSGALINKFDANRVQKELDVQTKVIETFDVKRQQAKAEIYGNVQAKRDQAQEIRVANDGIDTEESRQLDQAAADLQRVAKYVDAIAISTMAGPDVSDQVTGQLVANADLARRAATLPTKIVLQVCETSGQNCTQREVRRDQVTAGPDGQLYVFNNGIFNGEEKALANSARQSTNEANKQGVYAVLNPETGSPVAEALYAGYDKLNELSGGRLPLTSAASSNVDLVLDTKLRGDTFNSVNHSRGSMTMANALLQLRSSEARAIPIGTIIYNGAAANALRSSQVLSVITEGKGSIYQSTQATDLVGRLVGANRATGSKNAVNFPDSHSSYTGYLPSPGAYIGGINMRNLTDISWGEGSHSVPELIRPASRKTRSDE